MPRKATKPPVATKTDQVTAKADEIRTGQKNRTPVAVPRKATKPPIAPKTDQVTAKADEIRAGHRTPVAIPRKATKPPIAPKTDKVTVKADEIREKQQSDGNNMSRQQDRVPPIPTPRKGKGHYSISCTFS